MGRETFHVSRTEGRYKYGLKETSDIGSITVTPHTTDPLGSGMDISEAVQLAIQIQRTHHAGKTISLDFNLAEIPVGPNANAAALVQGYSAGTYDKPATRPGPRM